MREKLGLWLAYWALRLTGNGALATISKVLPLIPQRQLLIGVEALDAHPLSPLRLERRWWMWNPAADGLKAAQHS